MTVSVTLPPDVEERIQAEAAQRSLPIEDYIVWLLSSPPTESERRTRSLAAIDALAEIGSEAEQRETFEYLAKAIDQDRLSDRKLFQ